MKPNLLECLCPYCGDVLEPYEPMETDIYETLFYADCESCRLTFVRWGDDDEWVEAAEQDAFHD